MISLLEESRVMGRDKENKVHPVCQNQLIGSCCLMWHAENYGAWFGLQGRRPSRKVTALGLCVQSWVQLAMSTTGSRQECQGVSAIQVLDDL